MLTYPFFPPYGGSIRVEIFEKTGYLFGFEKSIRYNSKTDEGN
jgi:hypothetical protein